MARLESGHTPSRRKPAYWDGDVPWIGIKDARLHHGRVIEDTIQHTTPLGIENSSARILPAGTVCLSRTASVGYIMMMGQPMATSQDFVNWVCGPDIDARFLMMLLIAEQDSLLSFASGTTHQTIYFPEVKAFHVCLPPIDEQRRIAAVLGALDDKIDHNRRMNRTLEATAQALFHERFVAPLAAVSAALSDGWRIEPLDGVAHFLNGTACQKHPAVEGKPSLPVIKIRELRNGITETTDRATPDVPDKYRVEDGDVLFSWSGSLLAKVWTGGVGLLNQHLFKVTSDRFPRWFYLLWVQHHLDEFQRIAAAKATTMGHIKRRHLSDAKVAIPPADVLVDLDRQFEPLIDRHIANELQSRALAETRDALLPELVSGRLRVPEAIAVG